MHELTYPRPESPSPPPAANSGMAARIRELDWSRTPLGAFDTWSDRLRVPLELCLDSHLPFLILWGPDLRMLFNDAYAGLVGGAASRALGEPYFGFWGSARETTRPHVEAVLRTGKHVLLRDHPIPLGRGRSATFDLSYGPLRASDGSVAGVYSVGCETTERVSSELRWQAEKVGVEKAFAERTGELERSRAFLDSLVENLPNMVFVKDAKELRFVRFNRAGEDLLGMTREELIGKNDFDFFPEEQARHFTSKDRGVLAGREIVDIAEEPISTKRGLRWLHTRKIPIFGADGKPEYLLGISDDITESREAESERLRLSREEAALLEREAANRRVTLLSDVTAALTASLNVRETLQRLAELMVPAFADWCTVTLREQGEDPHRVAAVHRDPAKRSLIDELVEFFPARRTSPLGSAQVAESGQPVFLPRIPADTLEKTVQSPRHRDLLQALGVHSCIVVPIRGREQIHGTISLMGGYDRTEPSMEDLRFAEEVGRRAGIAVDNALLYLEAQNAVSARDAFLSIASHELKTPLTSLMIQSQMRRRQLDRENYLYFDAARLRHMVETDNRQLDRLTRLIDDMLDVSRIHSGKLTIQPEPVNLGQLVQEVAERHAEQFAKAGSLLTVTADESVMGVWDRFRIEQVVTNLLTNAVKYGGGGPVEVTVTERGREALLEVRDHVPGIAAQDQERVFRQFERAVGKSGPSGLGLGLFIVKQIIELHGGSIRLKSEPGQGSRFVVSLPVS